MLEANAGVEQQFAVEATKWSKSLLAGLESVDEREWSNVFERGTSDDLNSEVSEERRGSSISSLIWKYLHCFLQ